MRGSAMRRTFARTVFGLLFTVVALATAPAALAAPANDDFDSAAAVPSVPFTGTMDATGATYAFDDPMPSCAYGDGGSVWYAFTPTQDATISVDADTFGSDYDTTLSVFTGTRGALNEVACNDDTNGPRSKVRFAVQAGTTYYLMVKPYGGGSSGSLTHNAHEPPPPPANDDFDNAISTSSVPFSHSIDATDATHADDDPFPGCDYGNGGTVWYAYTPAADTTLSV